MRPLIGSLIVVSSIILSLCGLAAGQNIPGNYAEPFTPRLATPSASPDALPTPSLTLEPPSLTTGASSARAAAGLSVHFNQPVWYAPGVQINAPAYEFSVASAEPASQADSPGHAGSSWALQPSRAATAQPNWWAPLLARNPAGPTRMPTSPASMTATAWSGMEERLSR